MNFEVIQFKKKCNTFLIGKFLYNRTSEKTSAEGKRIMYLKCREQSCPVRAKIDDSTAHHLTYNFHTHNAPEISEIELLRFRQEWQKVKTNMANPEPIEALAVNETITECKQNLLLNSEKPVKQLSAHVK